MPGKPMSPAEVTEILQKNPHLREHVDKITRLLGRPRFYKTLTRDMADIEDPNIIYPVHEKIFVHVHRDRNTGELIYDVIEPKMDESTREIYEQVMRKITYLAGYAEHPEPNEKTLRELTEQAFDLLKQDRSTFDTIFYYVKKNVIGFGIWDVFFYDQYLEDVRNAELETYVVHKVWHNMKTNVRFPTEKDLDRFAFDLGVRMNKRVSAAKPIVDGIIPETKTRVNIIYGREVSKNGTAIAMRLVEKDPTSIIDLIRMGTISPELGAYLWLALENGMSIFFCGPTAAGKTTSMRASAVFIRPDAKIYSVEDTPEVYVPHANWQATVSHEERATMFDLLKAALRSRPNYIIVGEIRGKEGYIAFQAMQTGHPTISTFHGGNIKKIVQRLTGPPISVPPPYLTNLNIIVIQRAFRRGDRMIRRAISVHEIEGYVEGKGIMTREVFRWDPIDDKIQFVGRFNSYILERKIALFQGYADPRDIYNELDRRAKILKEMLRRDITHYHDVWEAVRGYYYFGVDGLPFPLEEI
ncbi:MAG: type II/IV secretion system ATPase subunit [Candidatus Diapherotrites archaeon]|nr:type II/IV secretion system ATPase subunit [Candidatus Diapherotrites archaeon]